MDLHELLEILPCSCLSLDRDGNVDFCPSSLSPLMGKDRRGFTAMLRRAVVCPGDVEYIHTLRNTDYDIQSRRSGDRLLVSIRDATALTRRAMDEANRDPLTGLWNRRGFAANVLSRIEDGEDHGCFRVIGVDIDFFKAVNDTFGHPAGDEVIRQVGATCAASVRSADIACRWGGEEFFLFVETGPDTPFEIGERLREAVENLSFQFGSRKTRCTVSVGISAGHVHITDLDELIEEADKALYQAKENGRNRVEGFGEDPMRPSM